jgi:hypothetical protein
MAVLKHWCKLEIDTNKHEKLNLVFANHGEEDELYPLATIEIAEAQKNKNLRSILSKMQKHQKRICVSFNLLKTQSAMQE